MFQKFTLYDLCAELFKSSALVKLTFLSVHRISVHCLYRLEKQVRFTGKGYQQL